MRKINLILIILSMFACQTNRHAKKNTDLLEYLFKNVNVIGFVAKHDTTMKDVIIQNDSMINIREIIVNNVINEYKVSTCIFTRYKPPENNVSFFRNHCCIDLIIRIKYPLEKIGDIARRWYFGGFKLNDCVYEITAYSKGPEEVKFLLINFKDVINSNLIEQVDLKILQLRKKLNSFYTIQNVQSKLSGKTYYSESEEKWCKTDGYYSGKIIQFPGDTLSETDKQAFNNAINKYRKDQNLDTTIIIDTLLLRSMEIPLDPIEEGLRKYKTDQ